MTDGTRSCGRGFTLVELMATLVIVSAVGAVTTGMMYGFARSYVSASEQRRAIELASAALDRLVRELREAPSVEGSPGEAAIVTAEPSRVVLESGVRFELSGTDLLMSDAEGVDGPLCRDVEQFELRYLGRDGVTDASGDPRETQRIEIVLVAGGIELRTAAMLRASIGGGS